MSVRAKYAHYKLFGHNSGDAQTIGAQVRAHGRGGFADEDGFMQVRNGLGELSGELLGRSITGRMLHRQ